MSKTFLGIDTDTWIAGLLMVGIVAGVSLAGLTIGSYAFTRDPLAWIRAPQNANSPCGEGIHVTHNGQPIANIAIKELGSGTYTYGATNSTGYFILQYCSPVGTIISFQATDYGFQLQPHQIIEAQL